MLHTLGRRSAPVDLVGLLLECHQRIRTFARLAAEVGQRSDLPEADVIDACQRCARYFAEALPLHVADEEKSLMPRLQGMSEEVTEALRTMHTQHEEHAPLLHALLASLGNVQREPSSQVHRESLRVTADKLVSEFEKHLAREEEILFPVIRSTLTEDAQAQVIQELRARRQV